MSGFFSAKKSIVARKQMEASVAALDAATEFANLGPVQQGQGTLDAIELAQSNIGNYKPEVEESRRLTDLAAQGITQDQIDKYTNPYLQDVLDFSIRDMEDAAEQRRQQRRAITSKSGNDFASSGGSSNRYQIEDDLADRSLYREIGGLSSQQRAMAYNQAAGLATDERTRQANAGITYGNYANQTSDLGVRDVGQLAAVGEMQEQPETRKRDYLLKTIDAYGSAAKNAQASVNEYQKSSMLSQIVGAVGSLRSIAGDPLATPGKDGGGGGGGGGGSSGSLGSIFSGFGNMFGGGGNTSTAGSSMMYSNAAAGATGQVGAGGSILGGGSDRRLKKDIRRIGTHKLGIGLYEWTYLWGTKSIGVMADELCKVMPKAVTRFLGYSTVDYSMIGGIQNG